MQRGSIAWWAVAAGLLVPAAPGAHAVGPACNDSHSEGVACFQRWDIEGYFYAVGQTLTEAESNIATALLPSNTLDIQPDAQKFPPTAKVVNAYLYWSGARETADTSVEVTVPGSTKTAVNADKCYLDNDNRVGSLSKNFYACRADITTAVEDGDSHFGTWTVGGVDSVVLPGGQTCEGTEPCFLAASAAVGKTFSSCVKDGAEICKCYKDTSTCLFGQSTIAHASFSLVFVYEDGGDQTRSIFLYDGLDAFIAMAVDFDLQNLKTPSTPDNKGTLAYYVVEGDNDDVTASPFAPTDLPNKFIDNPGEKVTLQWGDGVEFFDPIEFESEQNPIWDDPFNGTTGVGTDIESYPLDVPANMTQARLSLHAPNNDSVNQYPGEICTDPTLNNQCGPYHKCDCTEQNPDTNDCLSYGCLDQFSHDGIGVAYIIVGFDSFSPSLMDVSLDVAMDGASWGISFDGDINDDQQASPGERVLFRARAKNVGSSTATHLVFVDPLPGELVFAGFGGEPLKVWAMYEDGSASGPKAGLYDAASTAQAVTAQLPSLEIGETITVYFETIVNPGYPWDDQGKVVFNQAAFQADFIEPALTDWDGRPGGQDPTELAVLITNVDGDEHPDHADNCLHVNNPDQSDLDEDGLGDMCDNDRDGDGWSNATDNCPDVKNDLQTDKDDDEIGDACDPVDDRPPEPTGDTATTGSDAASTGAVAEPEWPIQKSEPLSACSGAAGRERPAPIGLALLVLVGLLAVAASRRRGPWSSR